MCVCVFRCQITVTTATRHDTTASRRRVCPRPQSKSAMPPLQLSLVSALPAPRTLRIAVPVNSRRQIKPESSGPTHPPAARLSVSFRSPGECPDERTDVSRPVVAAPPRRQSVIPSSGETKSRSAGRSRPSIDETFSSTLQHQQQQQQQTGCGDQGYIRICSYIGSIQPNRRDLSSSSSSLQSRSSSQTNIIHGCRVRFPVRCRLTTSASASGPAILFFFILFLF